VRAAGPDKEAGRRCSGPEQGFPCSPWSRPALEQGYPEGLQPGAMLERVESVRRKEWRRGAVMA